jgi:hypothetical protein
MAKGFRPIRYLDGKPWNGATLRCTLPAATGGIFNIGDLVVMTNAGGVRQTGGAGQAGDVAPLPTIGVAVAGARCLGAIVSFEPLRSDLSAVNRAASTLRTVNVAVADPTLVFQTQVDNVGTTTNIADIGSNFDALMTVGTTASAMLIDSSTIVQTTAGWSLIGILAEDSNLATITSGGDLTTSTIVEVTCAEPQLGANQVGLGI